MTTLLVVPISAPLSDSLALFFIQVILILVIVRVLGYLLYRLRQPIVIGEIIAGILLGPSALGQISGFSSHIFPPASVDTLSLIASLGLTFFMFFLGLEVDPSAIKKALTSSVPIAVVSIMIPFGCGAALSEWFYALTVTTASFTTFLLFLGVSTSFTAFPVLARVLATSRLLTSPLGVKAISCAAVDDLLGWCALALTLSYAAGGGVVVGVYVALIAFGFILFQVNIVNPALARLQNYCISIDDPINRNYVALLFILLLLSAWFCDILQIHAFFGAFIFGICVPKNDKLIEELAPKIELLIVEFFLPIYFANSGLKTDLTSLDSAVIWGALFAMIAVGTAAKILPVMFVSRLTSPGGLMNGMPWRLCLTLGILMNTRGLVALIALNIGLSAGILDTRIFSVLIVFSLVTTFITPPALYFLYERDYHTEQARLETVNVDGRTISVPMCGMSEHPSYMDEEGEGNAAAALQDQHDHRVTPQNTLSRSESQPYSIDKEIAAASSPSHYEEIKSHSRPSTLTRHTSTTDISQPLSFRDMMLSQAGNSISTRHILARLHSPDVIDPTYTDVRRRSDVHTQPVVRERHTMTPDTDVNGLSAHPSFQITEPLPLMLQSQPPLDRSSIVGEPPLYQRFSSEGSVRIVQSSHGQNPLTVTNLPEPRARRNTQNREDILLRTV